MSDETWARVRAHFDDDQIVALIAEIAMINAANRLAVIVHQKGGSYQAGHVRGRVQLIGGEVLAAGRVRLVSVSWRPRSPPLMPLPTARSTPPR